MTRTYRCRSCGATWVSYPEGEEIERAGRCLRCDGVMVRVTSPEEDPREDSPGDPPPRVPDGMEDDPRR